MNIKLTAKETTFFKAYVEAIDFTETGDVNQPEAGEPLDETFLRESLIDCLAFYNRIMCHLSDDMIEQAGHDFWFTRNGHGVGFWSRPEIYKEYQAELFTKHAQSFGGVNAYFENWINLGE